MRGDVSQRHDVRGRVGAIIGGGHHERRALARNHEGAWHVGTHTGNGPRALKAVTGVAHGHGEVALGRPLPRLLDEVGDYLSVGIGAELVPRGHQLALELLEVLDDAIVHDGNATGAIQVRMGIAVGRGTVGCPTRVPDATSSLRIRGGGTLPQVCHTPGTLHTVQVARRRDHLNARRVISTILKRRQSIEQPCGRLLPAGVSHYSTHSLPPWSVAWPRLSRDSPPSGEPEPQP